MSMAVDATLRQAYDRDYYHQHRDQIRARRKLYYTEHKDAIREYQKINKDKINARRRARYREIQAENIKIMEELKK